MADTDVLVLSAPSPTFVSAKRMVPEDKHWTDIIDSDILHHVVPRRRSPSLAEAPAQVPSSSLIFPNQTPDLVGQQLSLCRHWY